MPTSQKPRKQYKAKPKVVTLDLKSLKVNGHKRVPYTKPRDHELGCGSIKTPPEDAPTLFALHPAMKAKLEAVADKDCPMCHGSGVKEWNKSGTQARVCKCAEDRLEKARAFHEATLAKVKAEAASRADKMCIACKGSGIVEEKDGPHVCVCAARKEDIADKQAIGGGADTLREFFREQNVEKPGKDEEPKS